MPNPPPDFITILHELTQRQVDFIVIGGIGAVLQGAPLATFDLDLVHSRAPENLDRLVSVLQALDTYYREQSARRLRPTVSHLAGPGHHLLMTHAGPLDLLGTVSKGREYKDLLDHTIELEITSETHVKVLDLSILITLKEELGREKDLAVLPILRRTLLERDQG